MKCRACDKDLVFMDYIDSSEEDMCNSCIQEGGDTTLIESLMFDKSKLSSQDLSELFDIAL